MDSKAWNKNVKKCLISPKTHTIYELDKLLMLAKIELKDSKKKKEMVDDLKSKGWFLCDSKFEAKVCINYLILQKAKEIKNLEFQKRFSLKVNGISVCVYIPDIYYIDNRDNKETVIEVKGYFTELAKLKVKLFKACYPKIRFILNKQKET